MAIEGELLLSKVLTENKVVELDKLNVSEADFASESQKEAYEYIKSYSKSNNGNAPSELLVVDNVPEFNYVPDTDNESFKNLVTGLKRSKTAYDVATKVAPAFNDRWKEFGNTDPVRFLLEQKELMDNVLTANKVSSKAGNSLETIGSWFKEEYYNRKEGKTHKLWSSSFPTLNEIVGGGYQAGNMYTIFAKSGRGKSVLLLTELLECAYQGANVMNWSLEMGRYELASRILAFVSARKEMVKTEEAGQRYLAGFRVNDMISGRLDPYEEESFMEFLDTFNNEIDGNFYFRCADDEDFTDRSVREAESNINEYELDVLAIDPIYYMQYEKNTSKTTGGDAARTSMELRLLAGRTRTVIFVVTQAEEDDRQSRDEERALSMPKRSEVKKTKQVLEDASFVLAWDSCAGNFRIQVVKGRQGGEDKTVDGIFLPSIGYVKEHKTDEFAQLFE